MTKLEEMLIEHEGLRFAPYECTEGYLTIGVGRNLQTVGISEDEAMLMLQNDIKRAKDSLKQYEFWGWLDEVRKEALTDFMFNVGAGTFAKFKNMIGALESADFERASNELLDSRYAKQVGRRAETIASMIRTGER
jgi:lysozyme